MSRLPHSMFSVYKEHLWSTHSPHADQRCRERYGYSLSPFVQGKIKKLIFNDSEDVFMTDGNITDRSVWLIDMKSINECGVLRILYSVSQYKILTVLKPCPRSYVDTVIQNIDLICDDIEAILSGAENNECR